jgi:hypothetical protein
MCFLYKNEYRNLKLAGATMGWVLEKSEKDLRRWTKYDCNTYAWNYHMFHVIHMYHMCIYPYLKLAKRSCFSFYLLSFFFCKIGKQEGETGTVGWGWGWHQWEERGGQERDRRMNKVQKMYRNVCKCKNDTCWNCPRIGGGEIKEKSGNGEFKYDIFDIL